MIKTRVTELLGIETPIIEGGMAIAGNGELAAAVSNGGGLGVVSSNPGWSKQSERTKNVRQHLRRAKALTDKSLCANMSLQLIGKNPERHLDMLVEEGVKDLAVAAFKELFEHKIVATKIACVKAREELGWPARRNL